MGTRHHSGSKYKLFVSCGCRNKAGRSARRGNIEEPTVRVIVDSAPDLTRGNGREWFWELLWHKSLDPALHYPGDAPWIDEFDDMAAPLPWDG